MLLQMLYLFALSTIIGFKPDEKANQNFREIIIFAYADDDDSLKKQLVILNSDIKGLKERDLIIVIKVWGKDKNLAHQKYKIAKNQFTLVLIGKDGGEKYRSEKIISLQKLYAIIDAMPMRRHEMGKQ
jgi:hypothetical protein